MDEDRPIVPPRPAQRQANDHLTSASSAPAHDAFRDKFSLSSDSHEDISAGKCGGVDVSPHERREPRKHAFSTGGGRWLGQFLLFQLPAVAVTSAFLGLTISKFYWTPGANELGGLLFAAKVHESLIIASLFHVVYYHIRRGLLGSRGIPFGYLTSAFQLNSPFYLFSSGFAAPFIRYSPATSHSIGLAALLFGAFLLAALAGASSGIVMLPKLGWWDMPMTRTNSSMMSSGLFQAVIVSPSANLYPDRVDAGTVSANCGNPKEVRYMCPFYNFERPPTAAWGWFADSPDTTNLTTSYARNKAVTYVHDFEDVYLATCPMDNAAELLSATSAKWGDYPVRQTIKLSNQADVPLVLKQPRVVIQCTDAALPAKRNTSDPSAPYTFRIERKFYPYFLFNVSAADMAPAYEAFASGRRFGFLEVSKDIPVRASAAFWTQYTDPSPYAAASHALGICLVDARWVTAANWVVPAASGPVAQHTVKFTAETVDYAAAGADGVVGLDLAWLAALNGTLRPTEQLLLNITAGSGVFDVLAAYLGDTFKIWNIGAAFAVFLADALSMVPRQSAWGAHGKSPTGPWVASGAVGQNEQNIAGLSDYAKMEVQYEHTVYQYNFSGTSTKLAWAVLLLHVLLVVAHLGTVVVQGGWSSAAWGQLGELLALAVNTTPSALLAGASVKVDRWATWRLTAFVREADGGGRVEIVLKDGTDGKAGEASDGEGVPSSHRRYG